MRDRLSFILLVLLCIMPRVIAAQDITEKAIEAPLPDSVMTAEKHMTLPYTNWYSFEKPEPKYGRKFLMSSIAPAAVGLVGLGIYFWDDARTSIQDAISLGYETPKAMGADQLRYVPFAVSAVLPMFGLYPKHKPLHSIPLGFISYCFADLCVNTIKNATKEARPHPTLTECNSFPSQHTSEAFIAATFLHQEYGHYSPWISVAGYACATYVAWARVAGDYHWSNDVLVGAAMGTICTNLVYFAYDGLSDWIYSKTHNDKLSIMPFASSHSGGIYLTYEF